MWTILIIFNQSWVPDSTQFPLKHNINFLMLTLSCFALCAHILEIPVEQLRPDFKIKVISRLTSTFTWVQYESYNHEINNNREIKIIFKKVILQITEIFEYYT